MNITVIILKYSINIQITKFIKLPYFLSKLLNKHFKIKINTLTT